jgi:hypothetical protein
MIACSTLLGISHSSTFNALGGFTPAADAAPGCDDDVLPVRGLSLIGRGFGIGGVKSGAPILISIAMHPVPPGGLVVREGGFTSAETTYSYSYRNAGVAHAAGAEHQRSPRERSILVKKIIAGCDIKNFRAEINGAPP